GVIRAPRKLEYPAPAIEEPVAGADIAKVDAALVSLLRCGRAPYFLQVAEAACLMAGLRDKMREPQMRVDLVLRAIVIHAHRHALTDDSGVALGNVVEEFLRGHLSLAVLRSRSSSRAFMSSGSGLTKRMSSSPFTRRVRRLFSR